MCADSTQYVWWARAWWLALGSGSTTHTRKHAHTRTTRSLARATHRSDQPNSGVFPVACSRRAPVVLAALGGGSQDDERSSGLPSSTGDRRSSSGSPSSSMGDISPSVRSRQPRISITLDSWYWHDVRVSISHKVRVLFAKSIRFPLIIKDSRVFTVIRARAVEWEGLPAFHRPDRAPYRPDRG